MTEKFPYHINSNDTTCKVSAVTLVTSEYLFDLHFWKSLAPGQRPSAAVAIKECLAQVCVCILHLTYGNDVSFRFNLYLI